MKKRDVLSHESGIFQVTETQNLPVEQLRDPYQVSVATMDTSEQGSLAQLASVSDRCKETRSRLKVFVQNFVEEMEAKLMSYHLIREGKLKKAGKFSGEFAEKAGQISGGTLGGILGLLVGFPSAGASLGSQVVGKITKGISSCINDKSNMRKSNNLADLIDRFREDKLGLREEFVEAGYDVFQSFEMQFMGVTCDRRPEKAMQMFATDAVNRVINYMNEKPNQESISEGILQGKSKVASISSIVPGFKVKFGKCVWNTANLFEKSGIVIKNPSTSYYRLKNRQNKTEYGYRRLFIGEGCENIEQKYDNESETETNRAFRNYDYVLDPTNFKREVAILLSEINRCDKDLEEDRVKKSIQEAKEEILEVVAVLKTQIDDSSDRDVLLTIENSLNQFDFEKYFNEFKLCVLEAKNEMECKIQQGFQDASDERRRFHEQSESNISELKKKLPDIIAQIIAAVVKPERKPINTDPIWFDVRYNVKAFTALSPERLDKLREIADNIKNKIVVITSLDGMGKTELAVKCARSHHIENNVIFLNAITYESLKDSFHNLCKHRLNIEIKNTDGQDKTLKSLSGDVYNYFAHQNSLFIFKNAENSAFMEDFLPHNLPPKSRMPFILITSSRLDWKYETRKLAIVQLGDFSDEEAKAFVRKSLKSIPNLNDGQIVDLVKKFHRFPLALHQAVVYIEGKNIERKKRRSEYQISEYLETFERKPRKLLRVEFPPDVHTQTIFEILEATTHRIRSYEKHGLLAIKMLNIMSYFAPDNIPEEIFLGELAMGKKSKVEKITHVLEEHSIVKIVDEKLFMHGMIQLAVRLELREKRSEEEILEEALKLLQKCLANPKTLSYYAPHILSVWDHASKYESLIKTFIVDVENIKKSSDFASYFHVIAESHNYKLSLDIVGVIEEKYPKKFKHILYTRNRNEESPLHCAARSGNEGLVSLLLKKGACSNVKNKCKWTPLHFASKYGHLRIVSELLNSIDDTHAQETSFGFTPLHLSAQNGHLDVVKILLDKGFDVNDETKYLFTPLHLAAEAGHPDIVEYLLERNADVNARTEFLVTPLHFAVRNSHVSVADILIKCNAQVNASDNGGFTALHTAAQNGDEELMHILLSCHDIDVNAQTTDRNTPLHLAAQNGHLSTVQDLVAQDALVNLLNNKEKKALDLAVSDEIKNFIRQSMDHS